MFDSGELIDGRYRILSPLGQGGMARVYRASDTHLERDIALKVLRPHLTEADQERFRREIRTLAQLSHPGIVSIYDLGRGDYVYFAMELVEGGLFTDIGPLEADFEPLSKFLSAAQSVAEALEYVHRRGIIHRDLTPRNILTTPYGQPKVMDFGLVQLAEVSKQLTRTGLTLGTPHYMAPEQAKGDPIGAHTDLYALGAVLYRATTGVAPFEAENDQAVLYQHVYGDLTPANELNPAVPEALSQLIAQLLAKEPAERPPSAAHVANALASIRHGAQARVTHLRLGGPAQQGVVGYGPSHPERLSVAWQTELEEGPQWPGALTAAEGFILLGSSSEEVVVLHPADGHVYARFEADDEVNSAVSYQRGKLFFTSRGGGVYAVAWPSGERVWQKDAAAAVGILPYAGDLLVSTEAGTLERWTDAGECLWSSALDAPAFTGPVAQQRLGFVLTHAGWLHCLDLVTGTSKFKLELGAVRATPSVCGELLLLPEHQGLLHAFNFNTHEVLWTYDLEGELWASPVTSGRFVYAVSWDDTVRCLALQRGEDVWSYDLEARVTATPVLASGMLYLVTESGELVVLDALTGVLRYRTQVGSGPIQASPLVLADTVVVAPVMGAVTAYKPGRPHALRQAVTVQMTSR